MVLPVVVLLVDGNNTTCYWAQLTRTCSPLSTMLSQASTIPPTPCSSTVKWLWLPCAILVSRRQNLPFSMLSQSPLRNLFTKIFHVLLATRAMGSSRPTCMPSTVTKASGRHGTPSGIEYWSDQVLTFSSSRTPTMKPICSRLVEFENHLQGCPSNCFSDGMSPPN